MASGEVWRALPTTTWSISAGSAPVRSKRARAARAPSSIAERSAKDPLYSAIGVRTPSTSTRSRIERDIVPPRDWVVLGGNRVSGPGADLDDTPAYERPGGGG